MIFTYRFIDKYQERNREAGRRQIDREQREIETDRQTHKPMNRQAENREKNRGIEIV